jgi:hypothetical protein
MRRPRLKKNLSHPSGLSIIHCRSNPRVFTFGDARSPHSRLAICDVELRNCRTTQEMSVALCRHSLRESGAFTSIGDRFGATFAE